MALQAQTLAISFAQGMNTKVDPRAQQIGEVDIITDAIYKTLGRIESRYGYGGLPNTIAGTGTDITSGNAFGVDGNRLLLYSGTEAYSYSSLLEGYLPIGRKDAVSVTNDEVDAGPPFSSTAGDLGYAIGATGLECYAWIEGFQTENSTQITWQLRYNVYDPTSNTSIAAGRVLATDLFLSPLTGAEFGPRCQVVYSQGQFWVCFAGTSSGGNRFYTVQIDENNPTPGGLILNQFTPTNIEEWDACGNSTAVFIAEQTKIHKLSGGIHTSASFTLTGGTFFTGICIDPSTGKLWAAYRASGTGAKGVGFGVYTTSLTQDKAAAIVITSESTIFSSPLIVADNAQGWITYTDNYTGSGGAPTVFFIQVAQLDYTAGLQSTMRQAQVIAAGKPFISDNSEIMQTCSTRTYNSEDEGTFTSFLLRFPFDSAATSEATVYAKFADGVSPQYSTHTPMTEINGVFIVPNYRSGGSSFGGFAVGASFTSTQESYVVNRTLVTIGTKIPTVSLVQANHAGGGNVTVADSQRIVEHSFNQVPTIAFAIETQMTDPNIAPGTYSYVAIYSWQDAAGNVYRSAPSLPITVVVPDESGGLFSYPAIGVAKLDFTDKPGSFVELYRTTASGTVYQQVNVQYANSLKTGDYPDDEWFTFFRDMVPDSDLIKGPLLYSTGELENDAPPAASAFAQFKNRLVIIPSDSPYTLWYSKQSVTGFPVEFSAFLTFTIQQQGNEPVALGTMDDKLIIFKERLIFYMVGDGPTAAGTNNDFTPPQLIQSDCGCTEPASVVSTNDGVFFKGQKGIYLLDRGLNVQYIGANVEQYNAQKITSAAMVPDTTQVRFTLDNGTLLMYDYLAKRWGVHTNITAVDAKTYGGVYTYMNEIGTVYQETPGGYSDKGSVISPSLTTGWMSVSVIEGFQRVRKFNMVGQAYDAATVNLAISYDFDSTVTYTAQTGATGAEANWERQWNLPRQKCTSMQLTFTVIPDAPTKGIALIDMTFEAAVKSGPNRIPSSKRATP